MTARRPRGVAATPSTAYTTADAKLVSGARARCQYKWPVCPSSHHGSEPILAAWRTPLCFLHELPQRPNLVSRSPTSLVLTHVPAVRSGFDGLEELQV